ncbi:AAA family ATPase [uncultured Hymenobacter sp.]|uniref:AAA family ATPase n=1 Tax=uncultured Hymenobacter sp. TaxID=170016 RepID=UPI0035CACBF9
MTYTDRIAVLQQANSFELTGEAVSADHKRYALALDEVRADSDVPDLVPVVRINGETFAVRGDISFISGKPKAGKSAVCVCMAASALLPAGHPEDTLCINVSPANGRPVLIVDTEQPKANTKKMVGNIGRLLGVGPSHNVPNLKVYNFRSYPKAEKLFRVRLLFDMYPDAHLWIIDGLADLIDDVNGATESGRIVDWFMIQATTLNTTIVLVVHENPGSDKMRGHLGSEAERKGGGVITVTKNREGGYHTINSKILRNAHDFEAVYFSYSEGRKFFVTDGRAAALACAEKDKDERNLAKQCFPAGTDSLRHTQLIERIKVLRNVQDTAAGKWKKRMLECGTVVKREAEQDFVLAGALALDLLPSPGFQADLPLHRVPVANVTSPHEGL